MTIVVGIATPEGLVLAGDSRTTHQEIQHHRIASDNAQKVFTVGKFGIATWGAAFVDGDTIAGAIDQFAAHVDGKDLEFEQFTTELGSYFQAKLDATLDETADQLDLETPDEGSEEEPEFVLGFMVAGYDAQGVGRIRSVHLPGPEIIQGDDLATNMPGIMWRGQTDVIRRMIKGFDRDNFSWQGDDSDLPVGFTDHLDALEYKIIIPIALQDGIDCADFLIRTTVDMQRFSDGTIAFPGGIPGCGGPVQILAVERSELTWASRLTIRSPSQPGRAEGATR